MDKTLFSLWLILLTPFYVLAEQADVIDLQSACKTVEVFSQQGCPHCARAYEFLDHLQRQFPEIVIVKHDLSSRHNELQRFIDLNEDNSITRPGVPSFFVCGRFFVGFDPKITSVLIRNALDISNISEPDKSGTILLPWIGSVTVNEYGLLVFTVIIGLADGFNPCAMWVLLFLLSLLVNLKSRRKILVIAGTFVIVSGTVYFAFMAAWLHIFLVIGYSRAIQVFIALVAILIGVIHVKDFFAFRRGISLGIPEGAKPGLYARLRGVIQAESLWLAFIAVVILAILVNFLELLCTAGLPALYTQVLALRDLTRLQYFSYLVVYNLAYIFDDTLMVCIVVYTLSRRKLHQQQGRWLKLMSGCVMLVIGILLLMAPEYLF